MYTSSQRLFLAVLSGILSGMAWNNAFPAFIFISFVPLLIVEKDAKQSRNSANFFMLSWLSFSIWNLMAAWWIGYASLAGAAVLLSFNAFWMAAVMWIYHLSKKAFQSKYAFLILILYWTTYEYIYQRTEISWPWFNLGNIFGNMVEVVQWYEYTGTLGGTLWVLLVNLFIAEFVYDYLKFKKIKRLNIVVVAVTIFVPATVSVFMYRHYEESKKPAKIIVIQPNIDPYTEKFNKLSVSNQLNIIFDEARKVSFLETDYFVAPETAITGINLENEMAENPFIMTINHFVNAYPNAGFVIGAETQKHYTVNERPTSTSRRIDSIAVWEDSYNSALLIDATQNVQIYHKSKLVSGVEKMPFSQHLKFLEQFHIKLGGSYGNLAGQDKPSVFGAGKPGSKVAPVICFESVYGEYVTDYVKAGATLLFVITNDGWWKNSTGTWQHLNLSRLRAIETRRSVARSANTGISALINQRGEVIQYLNWNTRGAIKGEINENEKLTFYTIYGDFIGKICLLITVVVIGFWIIKKKTKLPFIRKTLITKPLE